MSGRRSDGPGAVVGALIVLLAVGVTAGAARAQQPFPRGAARAALSVLAPPVEHVPAGGGPRRAATDGMRLGEGDRVITGRGGMALVTFLDGTTVTVQPASEVTVRQADVAGRDHSQIEVLIEAGTVWARVTHLVKGRASVTLRSHEYAVTARDGLVGAARARDGTFVCWTRAGTVTLADGEGRTVATLAPDQKATARAGSPPRIDSFSVNASVLEVTAQPGVLPLFLMPDGRRVAGFVAPGIEVNHVSGSLTAVREGDVRVVEVPAGTRGPYTLLLEGMTDGPFAVTVSAHFRGQPAYRQEVRGTATRGGRTALTVTPRFEGASGDPRTAQVAGAQMSPLGWTGPLPGRIVISPLEREAVAGTR